jgi:hypothetical protein
MGNGIVRFSKSNSSGGGGVSAVTGTAPVVSSGGATPAISMPASNTSTDGYLSFGDWDEFNRKFGGFAYQSYFTGASASVPTAGQAFVYYSEGDPYEMRISYTTQDGITGMSSYFIGNRVGGNAIIIRNNEGQTCTFNQVGFAEDFGTYCRISVNPDVSGFDPITFDFNNQVCNWTFTQNPELATINNTSLYGSGNFTTSYAMGGLLGGSSIAVGTVFLGIGVSTSNATESNRSVAVATGIVTFVYLRIAGIMTGSMAVTLMLNGVATAMTFTIPAGSAAGRYTTTANQQSVGDGDKVSLRIVQSTATSSGIYGFGFIIT